MSNEKNVLFKQSSNDFPLTVRLGEKTPTWGLSRWGGHGLRFTPPDDEGFSLRGDKRRLVYKGRRQSHRFTILGDGAFEYDCIFNKEPDNNVVSLRMEGAEYFDFFRQPDFISDPFLKGSFAVYKKETLLGEGTGKLCHIHRPLIIDARRRRVWGDLSVVGNELRITIPEQWLSEAAYPVIVDPTIGTTAIGSQYLYSPKEPVMFEVQIPVNRFLVSETINGNCTAFFYTNADDIDAGGRPVLYSDNSNVPQARRSIDEGFVDLRVVSGKPAGWRSGTFRSNGSIASGSYIWFGCFAEYFWFPRFDYGTKCYFDDWSVSSGIPQIYPVWSVNFFQDFKLSMYFDYTSAQNYIRTITQGVTLTDSRKLTANYKRNAIEQVKANTMTVRLQTFFRAIIETVKGADGVSFPVLFHRSVHETATVTDTARKAGSFFRWLVDNAKTESEAKIGRTYIIALTDTAKATGLAARGLIMLVRIVSGLFVRDYLLRRFLIAREELVLKSKITREITLESNIN